MRARLAETWPNLSAVFGLHPWDVDRLTPVELNNYLVRLAEMGKGKG